MSKNYSLNQIKQNILKFILTDQEIEFNKKHKIILLFTEVNGEYFKNVIPIEYLLVSIMNIL